MLRRGVLEGGPAGQPQLAREPRQVEEAVCARARVHARPVETRAARDARLLLHEVGVARAAARLFSLRERLPPQRFALAQHVCVLVLVRLYHCG